MYEFVFGIMIRGLNVFVFGNKMGLLKVFVLGCWGYLNLLVNNWCCFKLFEGYLLMVFSFVLLRYGVGLG